MSYQMDELRELVKRFDDIKTYPALLDWLDGDGLQSLSEKLHHQLSSKLAPEATLDITTATLLGDYKVGALIGTGTVGQVYLLTSATASDRILKVQEVSKTIYEEENDKAMDTEAQAGIKAYNLGVGPKIYGSLLVPQPDDDKYILYIVQQRLTGPSMDADYPYTADQIKAALTLYYNLLVGGVVQGDFIASNVIREGSRWYLIDYGNADINTEIAEGRAKPWSKEVIKEAMLPLIPRFISSMIGKGRRANPEWIFTSDAMKHEVDTMLQNAANDWFATTFA